MRRVFPLVAALLIPSQVRAEDTRTPIGYATIGVGVAALATGAYFGAHAFALKRDADCDGKSCSPRGLDDIDSAKTSATLSTIGFGLGLVAIGVGTYLVISAPKKSSPTTTGLYVSPNSIAFAASF
jgi:hypothetical protein